MAHKFRKSDSMSNLIGDDYKLLQVMSRFGIALGFGDETVAAVCRRNEVDVDTFLIVCNYISSGARPSFDELGSMNIAALLRYLRNSHDFFLDFMLPSVRRDFVNAVDCSTTNEIGFLILKFFDDYVAEVQRHQAYEQQNVFLYVEGLTQGRRKVDFSLTEYETAYSQQSHKSMDSKLTDLKNIIIRYSPTSANSIQLNDALLHLFEFEADLRNHQELEDQIFLPAVSLLEKQVEIDQELDDEPATAEPEPEKAQLSQREKEIIIGVVKGLTNKEIADQLFISIHTVLTHRRNIAKKLEIHTPAGLVIYAIVNGIVDVADIREVY